MQVTWMGGASGATEAGCSDGRQDNHLSTQLREDSAQRRRRQQVGWSAAEYSEVLERLLIAVLLADPGQARIP